MERLTDAEKDDLRRSAQSGPLRDAFTRVRRHRHNPLRDDHGRNDPDRFVRFASEYNAFINHAPRRFKPIGTGNMKM